MTKPTKDMIDESLVKEINLRNSFELDSVTSNSSFTTEPSDSSEDDDDDQEMHSIVVDDDDVDDDDELCVCEQGMKKVLTNSKQQRDTSSVDTESLTLDPSLVSSFSSDTQGSSSPSNDSTDDDQQQHLPKQQQQHYHSKHGGTVPSNYSDPTNDYPTNALPQLRHRRDYSTTVTLDITEAHDGYHSELDENGLSPTAKHKPIPFPSEWSTKENTGVLRSSLPNVVLQFALMTYFVYYVLTVTQEIDTRWRMPTSRNARKLLRKIELRARQQIGVPGVSIAGGVIGGAPNDGYTIRLRGNRIDLLSRSIEHHVHCASVQQIQIDYNLPMDSSVLNTAASNDFPDELLLHPSGKIVQRNPTSSNGKQSGANDAILLLDEGVTLSCSDLERAYAEWKLDPVRVVGFFGDQDGTSAKYSLVSDRAMFVHRLYLSTRPASLLKSSTEHLECQHLALSAYVSAISSHSPLLISTSSPLRSRSLQASGPTSTDCVKVLLQTAGIKSLATTKTTFMGQAHGRTR